jgi:hypothetical protein
MSTAAQHSDVRRDRAQLAWALVLASCWTAAVCIPVTAQATRPRPATPQDAISAILDAFRTCRVVSFPGGHTEGNEGQALLRSLVRDPRFASRVNDIVVEFGSSRYQDLMDRYIRGEDVPESAVQHAWLNAVQAGTALDNPNTAAFFRAVREANATRPAAQRTRVLLGDPPIDWENVRDKADYRKWVVQRDSYPADLVRREVLARNRRALIVWANGHLMRQEILTNYDMTNWQAQTIVSVIEAQGGPPVFTVRAEGSLSQWQPDAASWKPMSLALVRGTIVGAADFSEFENPGQRYSIRGDDDFVPIPRDQWVKRRLEDIVDAVLYVGPAAGRTSAAISRTLCADPAYIKMRLDRIALLGIAEADKVKRDCNVK